MNPRYILSFVLLAALLLAAVASASASVLRDPRVPAKFESPNADLSWAVLGAGGGRSASASYSMEATVGQPFVGLSTGASAHLSAGFWQTESAGYRVFLPIVLR
jgi:hypothetical protein